MITIYKTNVSRFSTNNKSLSLIKNNLKLHSQDPRSNDPSNQNDFNQNLYSYSIENNISYDNDMVLLI